MVAHSRQQELFQEVLNLWSIYQGELKSLISEYEYLLNEKRKLEIKPLNRIKKTDLEMISTPEILEISSINEVKKYLTGLSEGQLRSVIYNINSYKDSYLRHTLKIKICDFKHEIQRSDLDKRRYRYMPTPNGLFK